MGFEGLLELVKFVQRGRHADHRRIDVDDLSRSTTSRPASPSRIRRSCSCAARSCAASSPTRRARSSTATRVRQLPVYFNQAPVLAIGGGGGGVGGRAGSPRTTRSGVGMNVTPMATASQPAPVAYEPDADHPDEQLAPSGRRRAEAAAVAGRRRQSAVGRVLGSSAPDARRPRVVMQFPSNPNDMLLSGTLAGGQALANRAQLVDIPLGKGHVVSFAIRPFWRWQTQGTYFLGFNAILNWNDLDAGRASARRPETTAGSAR